MSFRGVPLTVEMEKLTKEERSEIYIADRDNRIIESKKKIKQMYSDGELITVDDYAGIVGAYCTYGLNKDQVKGNIYRLVHMGHVPSVRMCQRCGSLDVNVRQIGYWETWDSARAVCMDCGWELGYTFIHVYIKEQRLIEDYRVWLAAKSSPKGIAV